MLAIETDNTDLWLEWLHDPDSDLRHAVALRLHLNMTEGQKTAMLPGVHEAIRREPDPNTRCWLVMALRSLDPGCESSVPVILACLSDPDPEVRFRAIQCLMKLKALSSPVLRELELLWKSDPDERVRIAAAMIVAESSLDTGMAPSLVRSMTSSDDPFVRSMAAATLGKLKERARPFCAELRASLIDPDGTTRAAALEALEKTAKREDVTADVQSCLADPDEFVRKVAHAILARFGHKTIRDIQEQR